MSGCRIGRIRPKAGGAEVRVISAPPRSALASKMIEHAAAIASYEDAANPICAFYVMALFADGGASSGCRYDGRRAPLPRSALPHLVGEMVRSDLLTEVTAVETVNRANGYDDPELGA